MDRKPPAGVRKALRKEIGFGCPVEGCGSPYLEWHHFDPPWHIENHHQPEGMIALCRLHHIQADNGAFTSDQLRAFKERSRENWKLNSGKFNWMRNRLLAVVGGNFYYNTNVILQVCGQPIIWFERNEDGYLTFNAFMLSEQKEPRAYIRDNIWYTTGNEKDIECPPSAKSIKIEYDNGDKLKLNFFELTSLEQAKKKYPEACFESLIEFPVTAVELTIAAPKTEFNFDSKKSQLPGFKMSNGFFVDNSVAVSIF